MVKNEVSIVKVKTGSIEEAVKRAVDLVGGIRAIVKKGDRVFVKPNAVVPLPPSTGVVTDPAVIRAIIKIVLGVGAKRVVVGDSPFLQYKSREALTKTGIAEAARDAGAEIAYLDEEPYEEVEAPNAKILKRISLPRSFLDCNIFVTAPKMKTHNQTGVSLSIKNQHGLLKAEDKKIMHRDDIHQKIVDITSLAKPDLIVVDGTIGLEGQGPTYGSPVEVNLILAGTNVVSTDAVASYVMGFEPESITSLRVAQTQGLGTLDMRQIGVKGENPDSVRLAFRKPSTEVVGVFPHVNAFVGGPCQGGCYAWTRVGLDGMKKHGILDKLEEDVNIIMGVSPVVPEMLHGKTFVIGDCARKHKDRGIFIPGCPPFDTWKIRTYFSED
jgi:uncharacterized protein (DUF362 family)